MTVSSFVECNDCNERYRVRYGIGNNYPQSATFHCTKCAASIETGYKVLGEESYLIGAKFIFGGDLWNQITNVINLHPEIPTNKENINDPSHFQTMSLFQMLHENKKNIFKFKEEQINWSKFYDEWDSIKKPLRILISKGEEGLNTICSMTKGELVKKYNDWVQLFLQGEFEQLYEGVTSEFESIDSDEIATYVKQDESLIIKIYDFCKTYMKHCQYFQSTYFYQIYGWKLNEELVPNVNWEEISTVYGDMYELLGDFFVIPTIINNIKSGRNFDEFISDGFTLEKYKKTDKANRAVNFEKNSNLSGLSVSYHSWLRNGTHHKNSNLDHETFEVSLGIGKGGKVEKKTTLIDYIKYCNAIFASGVILSGLLMKSNY